VYLRRLACRTSKRVRSALKIVRLQQFLMLRLLAEGINSGYLALIGYSLGRSTMRLSFRPLDSGNAGGIKVGGSTFPDADRLYLEAPDERGPVEGLTPNDAAIFDGGRKRETTRLVPQTIPCASSLLVDNARSTQRFSQEIRSGIVALPMRFRLNTSWASSQSERHQSYGRSLQRTEPG